MKGFFSTKKGPALVQIHSDTCPVLTAQRSKIFEVNEEEIEDLTERGWELKFHKCTGNKGKMKRNPGKMTRKMALDAMNWSSDPLVREIASEIDDRDLEDIAQGVYDIYFGTEEAYDETEQEDYIRSFEEPRATNNFTKDEAVEATLLASNIVDWANYAIAYRDYSNPPWEREDMSRTHRNPKTFSAKGERMYGSIKRGYGKSPRAKEIAARTVYKHARKHPELLKKKYRGNPEGIRGYGPGKFYTILDGYVYTSTLDGGPDDEVSYPEGEGWYGLVKFTKSDAEALQRLANEESDNLTQEEIDQVRESAGVILFERSDGIVEAEWYDSPRDLKNDWDSIVSSFEEEDFEED